MKAPLKIRVVQYGLGSIGLATAKQVLKRRDMELVGVIDNDPKKLNRDVADLSGMKRPSGIRVSDRAEEVLGVTHPDVVLHSTGSHLKSVIPQLQECINARASVVSSCEELLMPQARHVAQSRDLDHRAKARGVVVLGTGVNPGYAMDTMALAATAPCLEVKAVKVERLVDAGTRRLNLQRKVGAGMTKAEFRKGVKKSQLGHVGLLESLHLVADGLGWKLERVDESIKPVLATRGVKTDHLKVKAGEVAGIHHVCKGLRNGKTALVLDLQMYVGAKKPFDRVTVNGTPPVNLLFEGGIAGDEATTAMLIAMVHQVRGLEPGLRLMSDVPIPRFRAG